ncbi:MAG: hypothetical protein IJS38_01155 [Erysipelotrichaceae bacterium]|nr:hypothetical protein [Erysipelotrichaceae bacterium]
MKKGYVIASAVMLAIVNALFIYFGLPVVSIHNPLLWLMAMIDATVIAVMFLVAKQPKAFKASTLVTGLLLIGLIVGAISSTRLLNARRYTALLDIKTEEKVALPGVKDLKQIPLMDTESSKVLGNRKIGALSDIVSQFEVSDNYMTISWKDSPVKVSPLVYAGLWKWSANRDKGVPGYVMVRPNDLTAEYVELKEGMKYVPSACFSEDLARHIWAHYPTVFFDNLHFEIDEQGNPYYVATIYEHNIGLFGGKKITGAFVVDPVSGQISRYGTDDLPDWVDIVFYGDYIAKYFDIYGRLINGYWNSWFGQKGLIESTTTTTYNSEGNAVRDNDFGYIVRGKDIYIYTGVTAVTNDESNIGYLMANERTGEIRVSYFESTDEDSVMRAAEGEVQEKGYRASFPSLIDINGTSAYVMVLKDNLGLVKMYAIVDASQYSHMEVEDTLEKALNKFTSGSFSDDMKTVEITVRRCELVVVSGQSYVYLVDTANNIYKAVFEEKMLLIEEGDVITINTDGSWFTLND